MSTRERQRVADITGAVLREFNARLEGHVVENHVPSDLTVDADRALLQLAVRQLLDNAVKYSPAASTIEVRASGNGEVRIAVRNSGSVIAEHDRERIFERFYRGEACGAMSPAPVWGSRLSDRSRRRTVAH